MLTGPSSAKGHLVIIGLLCGLLWAVGLQAQTVSARLPSGITVSAEYQRGEANRLAVLILHGFMTTRDFNTVQSLYGDLSSSGYTVLAPTLSLGIANREASVPCDAIHTHTWDNDVAEISFWVDWLVKQGVDSIVLVGHSTGSLQLVSYVAGNPASQVKKVVATSLVNIRRYTAPETAKLEIAEAEKLAAMSHPPLRSYHLVFCDNFTATPESYLSYINWTRQRVLDTLSKVKVPVEVIMGGADRRFSSDWIQAVRDTGTEVRVIKGASHFFDSTHEFDLLDMVQQAIEGAS